MSSSAGCCQGPGALALLEEAERPRLVMPGEEMALEVPHSSLPVTIGRLLRCSQAFCNSAR